MHTHFGALVALHAFLSTLLLGTLWKQLSARAVASNSPTLQGLGGAMANQY